MCQELCYFTPDISFNPHDSPAVDGMMMVMSALALKKTKQLKEIKQHGKFTQVQGTEPHLEPRCVKCSLSGPQLPVAWQVRRKTNGAPGAQEQEPVWTSFMYILHSDFIFYVLCVSQITCHYGRETQIEFLRSRNSKLYISTKVMCVYYFKIYICLHYIFIIYIHVFNPN